MPYDNRADLPESVREHLPAHAQDIYKEASTAPGTSTARTRAAPIASPGARSSANTTRIHWASGSKERRRTRRAGSEALQHVTATGHSKRPRAIPQQAANLAMPVVDLRSLRTTTWCNRYRGCC